jgi:ABC-type polysaccharide/polyol phosphate transport system ATPase subunit
MSSDMLAIRVDGVSKRFELFDHPRDQLKQFVLPKIRRLGGLSDRQYFREFWALRDVSLNVPKGESWGIVGLNGSGKSTLLQIIAGTLTPTMGRITTHGRIAALLELGSGFNPEFTGRENVYMNGVLLGLSREQISTRIEEIERFADIGEHFDRPLTTYSSGMQMRVAFAVATSFEPDILIVDEALAVGDAYFQQKCFRRLENFKNAGGTLLFVSHDANAVKHLCDKAVLISHGRAISAGAPRDVIDLYEGLVAQKSDLGERAIVVAPGSVRSPAETSWQKATMVTTNEDAELLDFRLLSGDSRPVTVIESESHLTVEYVVKLRKDFDRPAFGLIVRDRIGRSIFETSTYAMRMAETAVTAGSCVRIRFAFSFNLRVGQYSFSVGVANRGFGRSEFEEYSLLMHDVQQLQVIESPTTAFYGGVFNMAPIVSVDVLEKSDA